MARMHLSLSKAESDLVEQLAGLTHARRTDVIKNALAVYHWFVRHAITGAKVIARKPTGEEFVLEMPELSVLESKASRLDPQELGCLGKELAGCTDEARAALIAERLARSFYGI